MCWMVSTRLWSESNQKDGSSHTFPFCRIIILSSNKNQNFLDRELTQKMVEKSGSVSEQIFRGAPDKCWLKFFREYTAAMKVFRCQFPVTLYAQVTNL